MYYVIQCIQLRHLSRKCTCCLRNTEQWVLLSVTLKGRGSFGGVSPWRIRRASRPGADPLPQPGTIRCYWLLLSVLNLFTNYWVLEFWLPRRVIDVFAVSFCMKDPSLCNLSLIDPAIMYISSDGASTTQNHLSSPRSPSANLVQSNTDVAGTSALAVRNLSFVQEKKNAAYKTTL